MLGIRSLLDLSINNTNVIVWSHTSSMFCNLGISNERRWKAILLILTFRSRQEKKRGRRKGGMKKGNTAPSISKLFQLKVLTYVQFKLVCHQCKPFLVLFSLEEHGEQLLAILLQFLSFCKFFSFFLKPVAKSWSLNESFSFFKPLFLYLKKKRLQNLHLRLQKLFQRQRKQSKDTVRLFFPNIHSSKLCICNFLLL